MLRALSRPKPEQMLAVEDEKAPADLRVHIRGDVGNLGAPAPRGFLTALLPEGAPRIDPASSGRLRLAEWIARPDHPLTARVLVNRLWHHTMGEGLVRTVDNFGARGERRGSRREADRSRASSGRSCAAAPTGCRVAAARPTPRTGSWGGAASAAWMPRRFATRCCRFPGNWISRGAARR